MNQATVEAFENASAMVQKFGTSFADATRALRDYQCAYCEFTSGARRFFVVESSVRERRHAPATLRRRGARGRARVVRDAIRGRGVAL